MFRALYHIAKWNGRCETAIQIEEHFESLNRKDDLEAEKLQSETFNTKSQYIEDPTEARFDTKKLLMSIGLIFVIGNNYLSYGMTLLITQKIGIDNIYINGTLFGLSELVAAIITILIAAKVRRRMLNIISCLIIILAAIILLLFRLLGLNHDAFGRVTESIISVVIKLVICINFNIIFTYAAELLHTKQRGIVIGIAVFVGNLFIGVAVYLDKLADILNVHPMVMLSIGASIALVISVFLPETLYTKLGN